VHAKRLAGSRLLAALLLVTADVAAAGQDTTLLDAARAADSTRVMALLEQDVSANARQADGATALHWAAHWDDAAMAEALLAAGADVHAENDFGVTALWLACLNGSEAMVAALLAAGADAKAALPSGETVLMTASRTGSAEAVRLLASHGADLNAREHTRGQTALMWAVAQQHPDVVETLVALGADVHARSAPLPRRIHTRTAGFNPSGVVDVVQGSNTPLLFAARQGDLHSARHLVAAGADVNDTAATGTSALVVAAHSGHTTLARFLLEQGADPNAAEAGYTALHAATLRGDQTLAAALLARGADPNAPVERGSPGRRNSPDYVLEHDVVGATAFWLAGHFAEPGIMRVLSDNGADPQIVMEDGTTPLMAAAAARRRREPGLAPNPVEDERRVLEAARAAIEAGVDVNAADPAGNTALHTAAARRLDTVVQLLADSGADLHALNDDGQSPLARARGRGSSDNSTVELLRRLGATGGR
jgi:ankyrin repeat protein